MRLTESDLSIIHVSTCVKGGGAERVALNLHQQYRARGMRSWLAVGEDFTSDPDVLALPRAQHFGLWTRCWRRAGHYVRKRIPNPQKAERVSNLLLRVGQPKRLWDWWRGVEDFNFPATWRLLDIAPQRPDIVHCHNLHGGYFDLRYLSHLSHQVPVVLTLHDAWLLSGHCAHSLGCDKWKAGCGHCPDLSLPPHIHRDASAYNWRRKRDIYAKSRLYVATPSHWLMERVEQSILLPGMVASRVIPNGVDVSVFHTGDKNAARATLKIPHDAKVLLFTAATIQRNVWKDYPTLRGAAELMGEALRGQGLLFLAVGENGETQRFADAEVRFIPYQKDARDLARYYQAADVYIHPARVEVWGCTITEALACGIPVVATAVGGIPEQVRSLGHAVASQEVKAWERSDATGILTPPGNPKATAEAALLLLKDSALRTRLGENAVRDAQQRLNLDRQADAYLRWYEEILSSWRSCTAGRL